jgi:hypothetical protein
MGLLAHHARGARTSACRVHICVNAVIDSASLCSEGCEHGTHERAMSLRF